MDKNRKTGVPIKSIPDIVQYLLEAATVEELEWMAGLAAKRREFGLFTRLLTRLTDANVHEVFYAKGVRTPEDIYKIWLAKRGEVAGLKAFARACQVAKSELSNRRGSRE
jgi:hypothetical protein